jgi:beta-lactamase class C
LKRFHLLVFSLVFALLPNQAHSDSFAAKFESDHVLPLIKKSPGGALVIVENGKVVLQQVYGVRKEGESQLVTAETLFRIASLSKTFASAAASILVKETPLTWQEPLRPNLAHVKFKESSYGGQISLRHLMSQSSGLMPHAYTNLIEENMSYRRIIDRLDRVDFVCAPGNCYGYQNVVFSLIADLVESETEFGYPEFVDANLFKPLAMSRASFGHKSFVNDPNHARPHVWTGTRWRSVKPTSHYYKVAPAAGINASISDMREWLLAQLGNNPEVLPVDMLNEMQQGVIRTSRREAHYPYRKALGDIYYGLGWRVFDYGGAKGFVHHGGYVKGMCSTMVFHRESGIGMVLLTNSEARGMNDLVLNFAATHAARLSEIPPTLAKR